MVEGAKYICGLGRYSGIWSGTEVARSVLFSPVTQPKEWEAFGEGKQDLIVSAFSSV